MRAMTHLLRILRLNRRATLNRAALMESGPSEIPCHVCGASASGWDYTSSMQGGQQVIEGSPVCDAHAQSRVRRAAG